MNFILRFGQRMTPQALLVQAAGLLNMAQLILRSNVTMEQANGQRDLLPFRDAAQMLALMVLARDRLFDAIGQLFPNIPVATSGPPSPLTRDILELSNQLLAAATAEADQVEVLESDRVLDDLAILAAQTMQLASRAPSLRA